MALVKIKLASSSLAAEIYFNSNESNAIQAVRAALAANLYTESNLFRVDGDSADAAEDTFDLTNNPSRQAERELKYGNGRSVSVGDVVVVEEEQWLCMSSGWVEV